MTVFRCRKTLRPALVAIGLAAGVAHAGGTDTEDDGAALRQGRDRAAVCLPLMEHDAGEFLDCVRYRAQLPVPPSRSDRLRQLGAYWYGWVTADIHGAYALAGADAAAAGLLSDCLRLQAELAIDDERLCPLVDPPCERISSRKQERLRSGG